MSGIGGWLDLTTGETRAATALDRMTALVSAPDGAQVESEAGRTGAIAAAGPDGTISIARNGDLLVAVWGEPRFLDARIAQLVITEGTAAALARAYRHQGSNVLQTMEGVYALALVDEAERSVLIATDRLGTRPLTWHADAKRFVFASSAYAVADRIDATEQLDPQGIYNYVYFHVLPAPGTIFRQCRRLLPGECVRWKDGQAHVARHWEMRYVEDRNQPFPELKAQFFDVLRQGVGRAVGKKRVGTFLSGGTDSSTVAGLLGEITGQPANTYSIGFDATGYDEMEYARIAARHFGTEHHEYYVTPRDVVDAIPRIAAAYDQPFGNASVVPTYFCAKLAAADGIERLLGGDGGDELFGGNARYATQYLYSLYSDLPAWLRARLIEPLLFAVPATRGPVGKLQRYVKHASIPMPARYDHYNLLERLGPNNVFEADFLAQIDRATPLSLMTEAYRDVHAHSQLNRLLHVDLRFTLADSDLPKVTGACALAGMEVRFPLIDDDIVAFSAQLAPRHKLKRTRLRHFFKEALRGFLPEAIIKKSKHGFGLPFGPWLGEDAALRSLACDSLATLKGRGIVRPAFIDLLASSHVDQNPRYYGTMVWVLMMLEQWLHAHASGAADALSRAPGSARALRKAHA